MSEENNSQRKKDIDETQNGSISEDTKYEEGKKIEDEHMSLNAETYVDTSLEEKKELSTNYMMNEFMNQQLTTLDKLNDKEVKNNDDTNANGRSS